MILAWGKFGVNAVSNFPLNLGSMQFSHRFWRAFYDRTAFAYDAVLSAGSWLQVGSEERIRNDVIGTQRLAPHARVIEVGCGTASNRLFMPAAIHYIGMDISRNMLRAAKVKCAKAELVADLVQADAAALPFVKESADFVFAMGILQHVRVPEVTIREMVTVAKPGARVLIIDEKRSQENILAEWKQTEQSLDIFGEYFVCEI